jgi:hypothetical protein
VLLPNDDLITLADRLHLTVAASVTGSLAQTRPQKGNLDAID